MLAAPQNAPDAIRLLITDHQQIDGLFEQYARLREFAAAGEDTTDARERLALQLCTTLVVHAAIEEALFYPVARIALDDACLIDEALVEHGTLRYLIGAVRNARPRDPLYDARIEVLAQYMRHHVREEENLLFPRLRRTRIDLGALGRRMREHREMLLAEATLPEQGELPA